VTGEHPPRTRVFSLQPLLERHAVLADFIVFAGIIAALYLGVRLALGAPAEVRGPTISLAPAALPFYAALSLGRMVAAYLLSLAFTLVYGYRAAYSARAERVLMPLLDVLQSVPILSFLPVVVLLLAALLPERLAVELASIVLIFTSQVWNMTFAWYQALTTIPGDLREASAVFRFGGWMRLRTLELPFAGIPLIWNSMMSWAGGWFFLMAAEIFTVGDRDFRLHGIGAYLHEAASQGDTRAILWGVTALLIVIVALDQLLWRPLLAWADRFKIEFSEAQVPATSWFYQVLASSRLADRVGQSVLSPVWRRIDRGMARLMAPAADERRAPDVPTWRWRLLTGVVLAGLVYGTVQASFLLLQVPRAQWLAILTGGAATLVRVVVALAIALAWTLPLGIAIGTRPRVARWLQPVIQIAASVPATALFPIVLLLVLGMPGGINVAAILLMLMGTQWYLLFNVIAGATAIPQDLRYTSALLQLRGRRLWRVLFIPALFPYLVTGAITATGGAWNASIVAEYATLAGRTMQTVGLGALIAQATASGDYPLLLAATLTMVVAVVTINRLLWRPLYRLAEERYRLD
jgi:NitT/TauT family transport system permease protein